MELRVGIGHDVHRLVPGRRLVIGGVEIPYELGLLGHSDADVLVHALCDALLGAAALGDIGTHFPDSDPGLAGIDSLVLLRRTCEMLAERRLAVLNVDATVFAERPRLGPYRQEMARRLAAAMTIAAHRINIKATTTEGLGAIGRGEGIGATAAVLVSGPAPSEG
jgi:2-C-methyl-D-erythritol 2,4-cyclodiphosphate synthase